MIELKPFQSKGLRTIEHFGGTLLLADEMGLGKTIQALAWIHAHPELRPVIIVCPAHLRWHWESEARKFRMRAVVLMGQRPYSLPSTAQILILSYDILKKWVPVLLELKPEVLVMDEVHYIKSRSSQRSKNVTLLSKRIPHRLALSGTPLVNRPAELFPIIHLLWPTEFPGFWAFATRYCKARKLPWGWDFSGASRLQELHGRLTSLGMLRRKKVDVLKDLPPKQRHVVAVDVPMEEYAKARDNFISWLESKSTTKADRARTAEKIVKLGYLRRLVAREKLPTVVDWIRDYLENTTEKLAVYGIHKDVVRWLHQEFPSISVCVDGQTPQNKRRAIVNQFQTDRRCRLFFGNVIAAGTGIGLVAATHLLFVELSWVPGEHAQVEDRIHRMGQTKHSEITYLIARGTLEEKLCSIIQKKQEIIATALDGNPRKGDLDIFNQLTKDLVEQRHRESR